MRIPIYAKRAAAALREKWPGARVTLERVGSLALYRIYVEGDFKRPYNRKHEAQTLIDRLLGRRAIRLFVHVIQRRAKRRRAA